MSTRPEAHQGLACRAISLGELAVAPLQRSRQPAAAASPCSPARSAPYPENDAELFAAAADFEVTYAQYADFQNRMEHYWCLRWLVQERLEEASATVVRENVVRFDALPLVTRVADLPPLAADTRVRLAIGRIDLSRHDARDAIRGACGGLVPCGAILSADARQAGQSTTPILASRGCAAEGCSAAADLARWRFPSRERCRCRSSSSEPPADRLLTMAIAASILLHSIVLVLQVQSIRSVRARPERAAARGRTGECQVHFEADQGGDPRPGESRWRRQHRCEPSRQEPAAGVAARQRVDRAGRGDSEIRASAAGGRGK